MLKNKVDETKLTIINMKFLLPLLLFPCLLKAQRDTIYNVIKYETIRAVVNIEDITKSSKIDSVNFKGSFIKAKIVNQVLYIPTVDTLKLTKEPSEIGYKSVSIKLWKFTNKSWATYFCCQIGLTDNMGDNSEVAKMVLTYPNKSIPEKKVKERYWDHEEKTVIIYILKKQATYSN